MKRTSLIAMALTIFACSGNSSTSTPTNPPPAPPTIASFTARPSDVAIGYSTTLTWAVSGQVTQLSIDPSIGVVTGGSVPVSPTASTTYTLTAQGPGGSAKRALTVTTHTPSLHLDYVDPAPSAAKFVLVRDAASTSSHLVLDLKTGASAVTLFGLALNLPFDGTTRRLVSFADSTASALGGLVPVAASGLDPGTSPSTAAARLLSAGDTGPFPSTLLVGIAKHRTAAADLADATVPANTTVFQLAFDLVPNGNQTGWLVDSTTLASDRRFKAWALARDPAAAPVATDVDFAIGDLAVWF